MGYGVVEYDRDFELARHARGQLLDFTGNLTIRKVDELLDVPGEVSRLTSDVEAVLVLIPVDGERFVEQVVEQLLRLEVDKEMVIEKVVIDKGGRNRIDFRNDSQALSMERAEVMVRKLKD